MAGSSSTAPRRGGRLWTRPRFSLDSTRFPRRSASLILGVRPSESRSRRIKSYARLLEREINRSRDNDHPRRMGAASEPCRNGYRQRVRDITLSVSCRSRFRHERFILTRGEFHSRLRSAPRYPKVKKPRGKRPDRPSSARDRPENLMEPMIRAYTRILAAGKLCNLRNVYILPP